MRKHQSVGEMISTCCFVGMAFYLLVSSLDLLESGDTLRGYGVVVGISVLWAWRFKICNCQFC